MPEREGPRPETDPDPDETREWLDSLDDILYRWGPERLRFLLGGLQERARGRGVALPFRLVAPACNTVPAEAQPRYPGDPAQEERLDALICWNAMAMVVRANTHFAGLGGHLSTYASAATLYEVGFHHVFRGSAGDAPGDQVFIQGHSSPGIYARAFLEGRLSETQLLNFRQELAEGGGLSSYPHPWLMPEFWEFPSVSLGLGALAAIYQARFNRYLMHRGLKDTEGARVWAFLGDGETDQPESRGALAIATRDGLDNLCFIVNCNLQRLDGPVRGNGSILRELEAYFRGAGWNVIKVLWSSAWDPLFAADDDGHLAQALGGVLDGELQRWAAVPARMREELFGRSPQLARLVEGWTDEHFAELEWGGHDRRKVYAAYEAARAHRGRPSVILALSVKGWGLGPRGQASNSTHGLKKLKGPEVLAYRDALEIPLDDAQAGELNFVRPGDDDPAIRYLKARRAALAGPLPARSEPAPALTAPGPETYQSTFAGSGTREASTTMAFSTTLNALLKHPELGSLVVPIIPDETRTFGMQALFRNLGIYTPGGQHYRPVDADSYLYYREAQDGQLLQEGITESGSMASFIAAGTAYATHGLNTVPFYLYYSMFGFQRVGDSIWSAGDARCRGFLLGATFGRTTLNGEGLQHQDGHSMLIASAFPTVRAYDPAYSYETGVVVQEGLRRMLEEQEPLIYYIALHNENYVQPPLPEGEGVAEGILAGAYVVRPAADPDAPLRAQLLGSGSILPGVLRAAEILAERYSVQADVWSATSYKQLRLDAQSAERWNRLHPGEAPRSCHLWDTLGQAPGPIVASSDNVALVAEQISPWLGRRLHALGTDGFGRSDTRERLRRHFEIDAESVVVATLAALAREGQVEASLVSQAIDDLDYDPEKQHALFA